MRTTPRDINYTGPGSRLCVLRPELVAAFCQVSAFSAHDSTSLRFVCLSGLEIKGTSKALLDALHVDQWLNL